MHRLTTQRLDGLNKGVRELYTYRDPDAVKKAVLLLIARLIDIDIATVDDVQPDGSVHLTTYPNEETQKVKAAQPVLGEYLPDHPGIPAFLRREPIPVMLTDFAPIRQFQRTGLYNEVYRQFGVVHQMNAMPPGEELKHTALTMHRRGRNFSEEDRSLLYLLSPHFGQAYSNAVAWDLAQKERALLHEAFASQAQETIFLGSNGEPFHLSARAATWLNRYFPNELKRHTLPRPLCVWVDRARVERRNRNASEANHAPLKLRNDQGRLEIQWFSDEQGHEMLLLTEKRSLFAFDRLFALGLTRREAEVLRWLAEGKTDSEIGIILGTSEHTAHKHTQHILAKLGVSSRTTALLRICELLGAA